MKETIPEYPKFGENNNNHTLIIIAIIAATVIIISLIILIMHFLPSTPESIIQENETLIEPQENKIIDPKLQTKIQECANTLSLNPECALLYSTPDIENKCNQLDNLKNQCLYNFAITNERFDTCYKIKNITLQNKCQEKLDFIFISDE